MVTKSSYRMQAMLVGLKVTQSVGCQTVTWCLCPVNQYDYIRATVTQKQPIVNKYTEERTKLRNIAQLAVFQIKMLKLCQPVSQREQRLTS